MAQAGADLRHHLVMYAERVLVCKSCRLARRTVRDDPLAPVLYSPFDMVAEQAEVRLAALKRRHDDNQRTSGHPFLQQSDRCSG
ncbi:MAG: hypothetical protein V3S41_09940, partial [Spirochaetia bacterium]